MSTFSIRLQTGMPDTSQPASGHITRNKDICPTTIPSCGHAAELKPGKIPIKRVAPAGARLSKHRRGLRVVGSFRARKGEGTGAKTSLRLYTNIDNMKTHNRTPQITLTPARTSATLAAFCQDAPSERGGRNSRSRCEGLACISTSAHLTRAAGLVGNLLLYACCADRGACHGAKPPAIEDGPASKERCARRCVCCALITIQRSESQRQGLHSRTWLEP